MRQLILLPLLASCCLAADWAQFRSGPFELYTSAGARPAREALLELEQFRHALGSVLGESDLQTDIPIRVLLFNRRADASAFLIPEPVRRGRDHYYVVLVEREPLKPELKRALANLFLETNIARMPAVYERGIASLFTTLEVDGTRVTVGKPVPPDERNLDWARAHFLVTSPEYYGRVRVLLANLRNGIDPDVSYRNSFGKERAEVEAEAKRYFAAGKFDPAPLSGRAMSARDFYERPVSDAAARLALADVLQPASRALYEGLIEEKQHVAEAQEGLGLLELRQGNKEAAREHFRTAVEAGADSPRALIEYAKVEPDRSKAVAALERAFKANQKLAEPQALLAGFEEHPKRQLWRWEQATRLAPRNVGYWESYAQAALDAKEFGTAAKAWRGAEQAAIEDADRERFRQARARIEEQRLDWEAAERKRAAEEKERELRELKEAALAEVRDLERRYSADKPGESAGPVVPWWDGPKAEGRVEGVLNQIDCLGKRFRLVIAGADGKIVRLLIADPGQIAIEGGGEMTLTCGPQKNRRVTVEYHPKPDPKLATAGEVALIRFR